MAAPSKKAEALARLRAYLEQAESSERPLTDTALIVVAGVKRTTFYDYLKTTSGLQLEIDGAKKAQQTFLGDTPAGRNRRKVRERIDALEARVKALEEANLALLAQHSAFVAALSGPQCRVPAEKVQRAQAIALQAADRTLSGAGRREPEGPTGGSFRARLR
jgi:hypothetical protein